MYKFPLQLHEQAKPMDALLTLETVLSNNNLRKAMIIPDKNFKKAFFEKKIVLSLYQLEFQSRKIWSK